MLESGLVEQATYREAYRLSGMYHSYINSLKHFKLEDQIVYRITPKGNGLVFLMPFGGDHTYSDIREPSFSSARESPVLT